MLRVLVSFDGSLLKTWKIVGNLEQATFDTKLRTCNCRELDLRKEY